MTAANQDLEARILERLLDWRDEHDGAALSLNWNAAPEFFGMAVTGAGGVAGSWDRLYDLLVEMKARGLITGSVFVNRLEDLSVAFGAGKVLLVSEAAALEAEKTRVAAERDMLTAAQKAAHADREAVLNGRQEVARGQRNLKEVQERLRSERDTVDQERTALQQAAAQLEERRAALQSEQDDAARKLAEERAKLEAAVNARENAAEIAAAQWRSAGTLALIMGALAALFAVTHMGLV